MRRVYSSWIVLICSWALLQFHSESALGAQAMPSANEVLRRLVARSRNPRLPDTQTHFLCTKQTVTEEFDPEGRLTNRKVKKRESHSNPSGARDADKWTSENGINLGEELLRRFRFTLVGRMTVQGRSTFHLIFVPKDPSAPVRHFRDRLLNQAMGTIWVDEAEDELVKASIRLAEPVSFGILGAVESLVFEFERTRAEDGSWLTRYTDTQLKARKFIKSVQTRKRVEWSDFKRLDAQPEP